MIDIMYDIPSLKGSKRVTVNREVVEKARKPEIRLLDEQKTA